MPQEVRAMRLPLPTEHDLPPRWDGKVVEWRGWVMLPVAFVCPPRTRGCCEQCGSTADQPHNRGLVALSRRTTLDDIEGHRRGHQVGRVARWRLDAFRCPDCHHDVVSDMQTGEV